MLEKTVGYRALQSKRKVAGELYALGFQTGSKAEPLRLRVALAGLASGM